MKTDRNAPTLPDECPTTPPPSQPYLSIWSRSRSGEWLLERSYYEPYVRNVLRIPVGGGRIGGDGRYYIALPQGAFPSDLVRHPDADVSEPVFALVRRAS